MPSYRLLTQTPMIKVQVTTSTLTDAIRVLDKGYASEIATNPYLYVDIQGYQVCGVYGASVHPIVPFILFIVGMAPLPYS